MTILLPKLRLPCWTFPLVHCGQMFMWRTMQKFWCLCFGPEFRLSYHSHLRFISYVCVDSYILLRFSITEDFPEKRETRGWGSLLCCLSIHIKCCSEYKILFGCRSIWCLDQVPNVRKMGWEVLVRSSLINIRHQILLISQTACKSIIVQRFLDEMSISLNVPCSVMVTGLWAQYKLKFHHPISLGLTIKPGAA